MRADVFAGGKYEARLYNAVRCSFAERSDPPLGARQSGRVEVELARRGDVRRGGLERLDFGSVTELGLQVGAVTCRLSPGLQERRRWR